MIIFHTLITIIFKKLFVHQSIIIIVLLYKKEYIKIFHLIKKIHILILLIFIMVFIVSMIGGIRL